MANHDLDPESHAAMVGKQFEAMVTGMALGLKNELGQHGVSAASEQAGNTVSGAAKNTERTR